MVQQYLKKIGRNICEARKNKGFSQEKLAELVGKSRNYIGMVERGEINTPTSVLIEIALALNVRPHTFLIF